jgi:dinuclear metal center YbgI/SA1388 family protein
MKINDVVKYLEDWAPRPIAWEKDNIGLQVGNKKNIITNVLLALDFDEKVLNQAIKKNCNLIITHHPFIFQPIKSLDFENDKKSKLIKELIKNEISLYSAHTNLDYTKDGVSFELAKTLGLENIEFLQPQDSNQNKLVVYVPESHVEKVSNAIFNAGGGIIGEYSRCSSRSSVKGTFEGSAATNPTIGKANNFEMVDEIRLEILVNSWELNSIINVMKSVHPYEEPAYDVFVLKNKNNNYGAGAIGNLSTNMTNSSFLKHVKSSLKTDSFRYTLGKKLKVSKVAVCGGSCSEMFNLAISQGADAFITADVKFHTFQDAENRIMLIDAGHYETEIPVLNKLKSKLLQFIDGQQSNNKVFKYSGSTNPVKFYNK